MDIQTDVSDQEGIKVTTLVFMVLILPIGYGSQKYITTIGRNRETIKPQVTMWY